MSCADTRFDQLNLSDKEFNQIKKALKDEKFKELFIDYAKEISDPENRKRYESEIEELERERGCSIKWLHPTPDHVIKLIVDNDLKQKCFINICSNDQIDKATCQPRTGGSCWSVPHAHVGIREDLDCHRTRCFVCDVLFHPNTLRLAAETKRFRKLIHDTAIATVAKTNLWKFSLCAKRGEYLIKYPQRMNYKGVVRPSVLRQGSVSSATADTSQQNSAELETRDAPVSLDEVVRSKLPDLSGPDAEGTKRNSSRVSDSLSVTPEHWFLYKQEDALGSLGLSDYSTQRSVNSQHQSCFGESRHCLCVYARFPGVHSASALQLDVGSRTLSVEGEGYRLAIVLPHQVDDERGTAQFDSATGQLCVCLPIVAVTRYNNVQSGCDDSTICSDVTLSEDNVTPPKDSVTPPKDSVTPPENNVTPPENNVTPPENNVTPPKGDVTPPENNVTPPENNVIPPKGDVTSSENNVTSLDGNENIGWDRQGITFCCDKEETNAREKLDGVSTEVAVGSLQCVCNTGNSDNSRVMVAKCAETDVDNTIEAGISHIHSVGIDSNTTLSAGCQLVDVNLDMAAVSGPGTTKDSSYDNPAATHVSDTVPRPNWDQLSVNIVSNLSSEESSNSSPSHSSTPPPLSAASSHMSSSRPLLPHYVLHDATRVYLYVQLSSDAAIRVRVCHSLTRSPHMLRLRLYRRRLPISAATVVASDGCGNHGDHYGNAKRDVCDVHTLCVCFPAAVRAIFWYTRSPTTPYSQSSSDINCYPEFDHTAMIEGQNPQLGSTFLVVGAIKLLGRCEWAQYKSGICLKSLTVSTLISTDKYEASQKYKQSLLNSDEKTQKYKLCGILKKCSSYPNLSTNLLSSPDVVSSGYGDCTLSDADDLHRDRTSMEKKSVRFSNHVQENRYRSSVSIIQDRLRKERRKNRKQRHKATKRGDAHTDSSENSSAVSASSGSETDSVGGDTTPGSGSSGSSKSQRRKRRNMQRKNKFQLKNYYIDQLE